MRWEIGQLTYAWTQTETHTQLGEKGKPPPGYYKITTTHLHTHTHTSTFGTVRSHSVAPTSVHFMFARQDTSLEKRVFALFGVLWCRESGSACKGGAGNTHTPTHTQRHCPMFKPCLDYSKKLRYICVYDRKSNVGAATQVAHHRGKRSHRPAFHFVSTPVVYFLSSHHEQLLISNLNQYVTMFAEPAKLFFTPL